MAQAGYCRGIGRRRWVSERRGPPASLSSVPRSVRRARSVRQDACEPSTSGCAPAAVARKLAVLFWHLLARGEDYAYGSATLTQKKIRQMELTAGAPSRKGHRNPNPTGLSVPERRDHERLLAEHAELAYKRLVTDWQRTERPTSAALRSLSITCRSSVE
jgi:hypothetical protein